MDRQEYYVGEGKFWSINRKKRNDEYEILIRYGRIDGHEEVGVKQVLKQFPDLNSCEEYETEAIQMKIDKGYKKEQQQLQVPKKDLQKDSKSKGPAGIKQDSIAWLTDQALNAPKQQVFRGGKVFLGKSGTKAITVMLAQTWSEEIDPTGYYLSEKLDGMRMIWTGSHMFSRNGNKIFFPPFFTAGWPNAYLDGELWYKRDEFQKLVSITKKQVPNEDDWRKIRYMVFDAPELKLGFKDRYEQFKSGCEQSNEFIVYVPHIVCTGYDHLIDELQAVQDRGGEGLMLRVPNSEYEQKRSNMLLKVKTFEDDEAVVIGHEEGSGRCQGMLGALKVRNTKGIIFNIGSGFDDDQRRRPPKIGSTVTYKFYGVSKAGTPRFPIYLRQREKE